MYLKIKFNKAVTINDIDSLNKTQENFIENSKVKYLNPTEYSRCENNSKPVFCGPWNFVLNHKINNNNNYDTGFFNF